ncbi:CGNR zinc finger domain-containing protein [Acidobacterium sp. S8]|uniref:CGNR zinc finger domain-containing protein n=1 Tax=Acidobacterium sp. S8 TaxID=1641854 RepID=UPI001C205E97|nr:CGNR zinc finger domain-containing protein [Acidobacterium sp. S8]
MKPHKPVKEFQLLAGNTALDLVNTLDNRFRESGPDELLVSYDDLLRFVQQAGLLTAEQIRRLRRAAGVEAERRRVLEQVKELREALAGVGYALLTEEELRKHEVHLLQKYFHRANAARLLGDDGRRLAWSWPKREELSAPLWLLAQEGEKFFLSEQAERLRCCASDTCRWLFLDTSKNHTRRWCDMKICGNRMKARRYQARLASD